MSNYVLSELHYAPPITFFSYWRNYDFVLLEQHEHYVKNSFRNRCHILGANGLQRLSIPLRKGKHEQQSIKDVQIAYDQNWQRQHWHSIQSAYGRSAYFEFYAPEIKPLYENKIDLLWEFNLQLLYTLLDCLQLNKQKIQLSDTFETSPANKADMRNHLLPKNTFEDLRKYPQVFSDRHLFIPNLSIYDLLFCTGPEAEMYL